MKLSLFTMGMIHRSLDELMDWLDANAPGLRHLEVGVGGYSPLGHSPLEMTASQRRDWLGHVRARGYDVAAFNTSGNPLQPSPSVAARHDSDLRRTIQLAAELGVDRVIAISGCPGASDSSDDAPHFSAYAWGRIPDYSGVASWQWEHRVRPYWEEINALVGRTTPDVMICLELHPGSHVFNVDTFLRLNSVAPKIGVNLDPSHLFWQQMDPFKVIGKLGKLVGHSHGKDIRYHREELELNGLLDSRWPNDPETIPWDFAAVGTGVHSNDWWRSFATALEEQTSARVVSIEHEDRLMSPEASIKASAAALYAAGVGVDQ